MEIPENNEAEIQPGSSSSSSSPQSSPSSTPLLSSSPSHPQSFASSRSSQKGLSTRSSSRSSSSSSSPFSGPSSPAHAAINQAEYSASEELRANELNNDIASSIVDPVAMASSSSSAPSSKDERIVVPSNRQMPLNTSEVAEEHNDSLLTDSLAETGPLCATAVGGIPVELTPNHSNSLSNSNLNVNMSDKTPLLYPTQQSISGSGSLTTPNISEHCMHEGSLNFTPNIARDPSGMDGYKDLNQQQRSISKAISRKTDEGSSNNVFITQTSNNGTGHFVDTYANCRDDQSLKTHDSPAYEMEPEVGQSDPMKLGDGIFETAVLPSETQSRKHVAKESSQHTMAFGAINKPSNDEDHSQGINELQRARTMPSGSLEVVNGEVRRRKSSDLKRSSTDKMKVAGDAPVCIPGPKLSKRKQKKLVQKMATLQKDGTVELDLERSARFVSDVLEPGNWEDHYDAAEDDDDRKPIHPLQIAMLIVGTRGDVQPFVAIGKRLQEHGHRVRLATHANFEDFVLKAGLEFYPLGGDPKVLAGYMVKNKGFLPSRPSEIRTQKKQLKRIINSLLPACTKPHGAGFSFKAQAIIANPPAYGHVHVAEALKVPIHIFFTMPWTPTVEFPHPLSRVGHFAANRVSYQVVDSLIWWGIRGMINDFRKKELGLRPITYLGGPHQQSMSKLPTGYIWSPHLVPKPHDWGPKVDVVGFCFLNLSQDYKPPDQLVKWLAAGSAPIYIGFGSLPVEDPVGMTKIIIKALHETHQRGIIDKGWGGIGTKVDLPDSVYLLDNCPHDWLFSQCAAVVHHGGAGTTAAGLKAACPTTIVPFFGDQAFWGDRVHARGLGPHPIPVDQFCLDKLVDAIRFMLDDEVKQTAIRLAEAMNKEDGVEGAVKAFHKHLPLDIPQGPASLPSKKHRPVLLKAWIRKYCREAV